MKRAQRVALIVDACNDIRRSALSCSSNAETITRNAERPVEDLRIIVGNLESNMEDMRGQLSRLLGILDAPVEE